MPLVQAGDGHLDGGFAHGAAHGAHETFIDGHFQSTHTCGKGMHGVVHVLQGFGHVLHAGFAHVLHGAGFAHVLHGFAQLEHGVDSPANAGTANITATTTANTISAAFFMFLLLLVNCICSWQVKTCPTLICNICRGGLNLPYRSLPLPYY